MSLKFIERRFTPHFQALWSHDSFTLVAFASLLLINEVEPSPASSDAIVLIATLHKNVDRHGRKPPWRSALRIYRSAREFHQQQHILSDIKLDHSTKLFNLNTQTPNQFYLRG